MPEIIGPLGNVTAAVGKMAKFTCTVRNLNKYHVIWFHVQRNMLLIIHHKVVTRIPRFSVDQEDNERWTLRIRDVVREDKGAYACQVNTEPQLREIGYLNVVVPPEIVDSGSSASSVIIKENGNVTLTCKAEGNPKPTISWVREDNAAITLTHRKRVNKYKGESLELRKVSRTDMGAYLCIASNGVPPTVSKRTVLYVQFSPIVIVPNQIMSAPKGLSVRLECITEAYPRAVTYWVHKKAMVMSNSKYMLDEIHDHYRTKVYLTITNLDTEDYGTYMCNSRNSFGENGGTVTLHELTRTVEEETEREIGSRENYKSGTHISTEVHSYEKSRGQNQVVSDLNNEIEQKNTSWIPKTYSSPGKQNRRNSYKKDQQSPKIFNTFFSSSSSVTSASPMITLGFLMTSVLVLKS